LPRVQAQAADQERPGAPRPHRDQRRSDLLGLMVGWPGQTGRVAGFEL